MLIAKAHNPNVLNPDFLKYNSIVDSLYTVGDVVCTPPIAHVIYKEGISVIADFERLQFIDDDPVRIPFDSPIPAIAKKYMDVLPHAMYSASGINFTGYYKFENEEVATSFVKDKFIKAGPWLELKGGATDVGLKFVYTLDNVKNTISIEGGDIAHTNNETAPILLFESNYHYECSGNSDSTDNNCNEKLKTYISKWEEYFKRFAAFIDSIFGGI